MMRRWTPLTRYTLERNTANVNIPPYAPSQGGSWESLMKLFQTAFGQIMEQTHRKPFLIELHTFFTDAVGVVSDRPLTTLSNHSSDLCPITPSFFFGTAIGPQHFSLWIARSGKSSQRLLV